jgi:hypothetical protein
MGYKVGLGDREGVKQIEEKIKELLNQVHPIGRIEIVTDLFTANLLTERVGEPWSKVLTFKELKIGDRFILFPRPGDDHGHGGLKGGEALCQKIRGIPDPRYTGGERDNAVNLLDGNTIFLPPDCPVLKIRL